MARRVNVPVALATKIYMMALMDAARIHRYEIDMVMVACAIKYAGENLHRLVRRW
jgi:hypothetical protein